MKAVSKHWKNKIALSLCLLMVMSVFLPQSAVGKEPIFNRKNQKTDISKEIQKEDTEVIVGSSIKKGVSNTAPKQHSGEKKPVEVASKNKQPPVVYDKGSAAYKGAIQHVRNMSAKCRGRWETQGCMKTLSNVSLVMVSNYAADLKNHNHMAAVETLKQHCAASTAALQVKVPAYAMRSAMTECVNHISDLNDQTGLRPDPNFSQMIVGAILCIDKNMACFLMEMQLGNLSKSAR